LNGASLLVITFDPEIQQTPPANMLRRMFGLTQAEAEVAVGIACGQRITEIAAERGVKAETVRTHTKTVFGKTRTRSQAELVALLTRLAFVTPGHEAGVAQADALTKLQIFCPKELKQLM
jgi:DNA-binding CsgD family transcriptional regulator